MTLKDYVLSKSPHSTTERGETVKKIAEACKVDISTVYRWAKGKANPDALKMEKISELTGISSKELFPND